MQGYSADGDAYPTKEGLYFIRSDVEAALAEKDREIAALKEQLGENQAELAVIKRDYEAVRNLLVEARASIRMLINFVHDLSHLPKGWEMPHGYPQVAAQVLELIGEEKSHE